MLFGMDLLSAIKPKSNAPMPADTYVSLSEVSLLAGKPVSTQAVAPKRETAPTA